MSTLGPDMLQTRVLSANTKLAHPLLHQPVLPQLHRFESICRAVLVETDNDDAFDSTTPIVGAITSSDKTDAVLA